jgi:hypothetical protein
MQRWVTALLYSLGGAWCRTAMLRLLAVAALGAMASVGCGDDERRMVVVDQPLRCAELTPCGGDPVGTWRFTTACLTPDGEGALDAWTAGCPDASLDFEIAPTGTITFAADGTYAVTGIGQQVVANFVIPVSCIGRGSCEAEQASLLSTGNFETTSCSGSSTCTCTAITPATAVTETGEFSVYGDQLVLSGLGGGDRFCVDGAVLHYFTTTADGFAIVQDTIAIKQ